MTAMIQIAMCRMSCIAGSNRARRWRGCRCPITCSTRSARWPSDRRSRSCAPVWSTGRKLRPRSHRLKRFAPNANANDRGRRFGPARSAPPRACGSRGGKAAVRLSTDVTRAPFARRRSRASRPLRRYPHDFLLPRVWELRSNLTVYDAVYVALAEALGAPLLTRDRRLAAAPGHHAQVELV